MESVFILLLDSMPVWYSIVYKNWWCISWVSELLNIRTVVTCYRLYRKTYDMSHTVLGKKIVDHSDVVGASPVGAAQTTYSFYT